MNITAPLLNSDFISVEHYTIQAANKQGYVADVGLSAVPCNIQPTEPEILALMGGAFGKGYTIFTTASGILEGDRLTSSGTGDIYIVKGRQNFNYTYAQHLELYVEKKLG